MTRVQWLALGGYVALVYLALGPPLNDGTLNATVVALAHLLLGLGVARWWVLGVPVAVALAGLYLATDDFGLLALFGGPICVLLTAVGRGLAYAPPKLRAGVAALCAALIAFAFLGDVVTELRKGPPLPATVQRELPVQYSLVVLCPWSDEDQTRARASIDVLIRELDARPDHTLTYTVHWAHGDEDVRDITVRQLADITLDDLEHGDVRGPCAPDLQRRIRAAL
ncbi:hypothetical protein OJ997_22660 [Solirubrobacter phytolaccae]|uniref:Uncharacterized protein n=1 Tax=Solirubrobacter phytolaccae TaxID=1404360 RepID=A0A9X3NDD6_9ACTN|nr:hypothetical protein [Solirubrobacter phytolaccae]MDA0183129.1 hypothetical protein [Solirubrobacter phytolaccae]